MGIDQFLLSGDTTDLNYPEIRPSLDLNFARTKTLDPRITFTRASGGSYVGADGFIKYAGVNEARFDHDPSTGESLGLLIEESRSNSLLRSEEFNQTWARVNIQAFNSGSVANVVTAPDGTTTADKIVENTVVNNVHEVTQVVSVTASTAYTLSCFAKKGERDYLVLSITQAGVANYNTFFDLTNGVVGTNAAGNTATITPYPNGWYRCSVSRSTAVGQTSVTAKVNIATSNATVYIGDGASGIYIWGAQLERGSFPTSYIPTQASTRTRAADNASITGKNFSEWYRQDEGTVYAEASTYLGTVALSIGVWSIESSGSNVHRFFRQSDQQPVAQTLVGGIPQTTFGFGAIWNTPVNRRLCYAYAANNFASVVDTLTVRTDASGLLPTATLLNIGNLTRGNYWGGTIRHLTYYPKRLTNSQLQALTR
jgi:hypothetical protein